MCISLHLAFLAGVTGLKLALHFHLAGSSPALDCGEERQQPETQTVIKLMNFPQSQTSLFKIPRLVLVICACVFFALRVLERFRLVALKG